MGIGRPGVARRQFGHVLIEELVPWQRPCLLGPRCFQPPNSIEVMLANTGVPLPAQPLALFTTPATPDSPDDLALLPSMQFYWPTAASDVNFDILLDFSADFIVERR